MASVPEERERRTDRPVIISDGLPSQLPDVDPDETAEWLESLDAVVENAGRNRARFLMLSLLQRARESQVGVPSLRSTDYINTIPPESEPWFPGDEHVERRIRAYVRWNAAIMVHRAQRPGVGVGGHISTYASSASLYEVGFNHFFRGKDHPGGGDQIFYQGHASPGMYARAFLEGRLTEQQLDGFRQELSHPGGGLSSYPHPRLMPEFWEFPTVSMGLGPINAIYQARFNRYLHDRGIKDTCQQHVWAFLGDGEMDEPESLGAIGLAAREELDNLTFVINCNLQRLDGPVRGNGKVIQELESFFRGAGWNVIKVIWGREWDAPARRGPRRRAGQPDEHHARTATTRPTRPRTAPTSASTSSAATRAPARWSSTCPTRRSGACPRGGHDYRKMYAAYEAATKHTGQPTVILAKTIKGWTLGIALRGPQLDAPDEEADEGGPDRLPRPALPRHPRLGARRDPAALLPPGRGLRRDRVHARAAARARRLPARAPRSEPSRWCCPADPVYDVVKRGSGKQAGGDDDGVRPAAQGPAQGQGDRLAASCRSSRTRRARSAWTRCSRRMKIYSPHGPELHLGRPRADAVLQGGRDRASSCTRASTRPARRRRGRPSAPRTRRTASR